MMMKMMMMICSICVKWVSYSSLFFSLSFSPPPFCSSRPLLGSLSILPLQTFSHLVTYEKEKESVSEWLPNRMFPCNYHFGSTVPSVFSRFWVTLTKQLPKLLLEPYTDFLILHFYYHWCHYKNTRVLLLLFSPFHSV